MNIFPAPRCDDPDWYAIDTETTLFDEPTYSHNGKTRTRPFGGHRLVLGSVTGKGSTGVHMADALCEIVYIILRGNNHLVFHNASFDIHALIAHDAGLKPVFVTAAREGRIHDTMLLEQLVRIARGSAAEALKEGLTLKALAKRYAGLDLDKSDVRVTFGQFEGEQIESIPPTYLEYAAADAEATYLIHRAQRNTARLYTDPEDCRYPRLPDATKRFGLLAESVNVQGALALAWLEQHPVRVDTDAASSLCRTLEDEERRLKDALANLGYARVGPRSGKFSLQQKKIRGILKEWARERDITPEYSDSGLVSLKADFWSQHIPKPSPHLLAHPGDAETETERLSVWMRFSRVRKLLTTFVYLYASSPVHYPRYDPLGARTTRTSCTRPNIQQVPKRRDGIRGLFVASPDHTFIECDWVAAELTALAQVQLLMFGESRLADAINAGEDMHLETAQAVFENEFDEASGSRKAELRQAAKAVNFGLPGGMGARKFSIFARGFGVSIDPDEAKTLRRAALDADEELRLYLDDPRSIEQRLNLAARNLNISFNRLVDIFQGWRDKDEGTIHHHALIKRLYRWGRGKDRNRYRCPTPPGFNPAYDLWAEPTRTLCGAVRGRSIYTAAHNTPFQGSIAEAGKLALFELWASHTPGSGWNPVAFIHDSILIEAHHGTESAATADLETAMLGAIRTVCPNVNGGLESTVLGDRWGTSTNALGQPLQEAP